MSVNIRSTYNRFPKWTQFFWTWLTGIPNNEDNPLFETNEWVYLIVSATIFIGGTLTSMAVLVYGYPAYFLIFSLIFTVFGSRLLVLTIAHQCAHHMFTRNRSANRMVHNVITTILFTQDYTTYRHDHFVVHHGLKTFGTFDDPVLTLIRSLGLKENNTRKQLWIKMILLFVSPNFHFKYISARLSSNLFHASKFRILMSLIWAIFIVSFIVFNPALFVPFLISFVIPVFILYNVSSFLELICEHKWMNPIDQDHLPVKKRKIVSLCWGRFCGDPVPQTNNLVQWLVWTIRTVFYHLPCRILVLTGDAPQHDYHHVKPNSRRWTVSAYDRRDGVLSKSFDHLEIWGLFKAIDEVFITMACAQEIDNPTNRLDYLKTSSVG